MDDRPIGIFDSGLGGLTVLKEIQKVLPNENLAYLGDTARVPYGTRSKKTIEKFSLQCTYFLAGKGVKCIVVACNTSSSNAINKLKKEINIPIFDVVRSSIEALNDLDNVKDIGVIGTLATINSHIHKKFAEKENYRVIFENACPLFIPLVENGEISGNITRLVADKYLKKEKNSVDALIMACTHFPVIRRNIQQSIGGGVTLIDPAIRLSRSLRENLQKNNLSSQPKRSVVNYYITDINESFEKTAEIFLGRNISSLIHKVELD